MKEKIYTIPVSEAFENGSECPFCSLYHRLEQDAIEFVMGPSYMEDDIRAKTNRLGFCSHHLHKLYIEKNRLGLALMLYSHQEKVQNDLMHLLEKEAPTKRLFKKKDQGTSSLSAYIKQLNNSCYICDKIEHLMVRYVDTFFYMWKKEETFRSKVKDSKGFCLQHFGLLYEKSPDQLNGQELDNFISVIKSLYFTNVDRVQEDLDWFIKKFDYRYTDAPWKNGKDALHRTMLKTDSLKVDK